jgi:hypothetical protein
VDWRTGTDPRIPHRPLLACTSVGRLSPAAVCRALARGLAAARVTEADSLALDDTRGGAGLARALTELDFDARLRRSRALILAVEELPCDGLAGTAAFELATRARQGGIPAYAVTGRDRIDSFTARMLDLQVVLQARGPGGLAQAGERLGSLI